MFKKGISLLLCAAMMFGVLAGCGSDAKSGEKETSKTDGKVDITVAMWNVQEALAGGMNDKMLATIEEKTGVHLIPQDVTDSDYHAKVQLWSTNNQLPDIFCGDFIGLGQSSFYDWVDQGIIKALPSDLSAYPNLQEYMKMNRVKQAMQDGKSYIIPRQSYAEIHYSVLDRNIAYRWDLAQAAGVTKEPETWDEFRDMIQKIKAADPEDKKVEGLTQNGSKILAGCLYPYGGILEKKWIINEDGKVLPSYFDGNLKAAMQLSRDMYTEGTIVKDIAQVNGSSAKDMFLQGRCAAIAFNDGPASLYALGAKYNEIYGREFLDDVKFAPIFPGFDGKKYYFVDTEAWSETYINSNVSDEKMDAILRLYDYLLSDEGKMLVFCGFEGEDYELVDGVPVMEENVVLEDKYAYAKISNLAMHNPRYWDYKFASYIPKGYLDQNDMRVNDAIDNGFLLNISDASMLLSTPLKDKFYFNPHEDFYKIMMGEDSVDKMVDDMMAEYEAKGLNEMLEEVNILAKDRGIINE